MQNRFNFKSINSNFEIVVYLNIEDNNKNNSFVKELILRVSNYHSLKT